RDPTQEEEVVRDDLWDERGREVERATERARDEPVMIQGRELARSASARQVARGGVQTQLSALDEPSCRERGVLVLAAFAAQRHVEPLSREVDHATAELGLDLHLRVERDEARDDAAKERGAEVVGRGELQRARWLALVFGQLLRGVPERAHMGGGPLVERLARRGEGDATGRSVKEPGADGLLELGDVAAHRGGRGPQCASRAREAGGIGDLYEGGEQGDVDCYAHASVYYTVAYCEEDRRDEYFS